MNVRFNIQNVAKTRSSSYIDKFWDKCHILGLHVRMLGQVAQNSTQPLTLESALAQALVAPSSTPKVGIRFNKCPNTSIYQSHMSEKQRPMNKEFVCRTLGKLWVL